MPFPPEVLQPARSIALATGRPPAAELFRGNMSMGDKYHQSLTWDRITAERIRAGEVPLWTRDIAGGVPFVPQMGQIYHPANLLLFVVPSAGVYGIWYVLHLVLFGYFAYGFLRRLGVAHAAAIFGMVALLLGFWAQARVHHNVILSAAMPVFAMLSCTHHLFVHRGGFGHAVLLALATALSWISGFAPASLMITWLTGAFALAAMVQAPRQVRWTAALRFVCGIGLGLLIASAQLLPVLLAAQETSRLPGDVDLLAGRSLSLPHLASLLWPTLFTWPADVFYGAAIRLHDAWPALIAFKLDDFHAAGHNFPETALYVGLIPLALCLEGLRRRFAPLFAGIAVFGLAMALAVPGILTLTRLLPGAHAGDVRRFSMLFSLALPVLAALGIDAWMREPQRRRAALFLVVVGNLSLLGLAFHLQAPLALQDVYGSLAEMRQGLPDGTMEAWVADYPNEAAHNRARLLDSFATALLVCAVGAALLWRGDRRTPWILAAVTAWELGHLGAGTIVSVPLDRVTAPPALLAEVLAAPAPNGVRPRLHRLLAAADPDPHHYPVPPNLAAFYGAEDLGAYSPLPKRRMEDFFLALEPDRPGKVSVVFGGAGVGALRDPASLTHPLLDLIGAEWILTDGPPPAPATGPAPDIEDHTPPDLPGPYRLYRRTSCLPRATFVTTVEIEPDRAARLRRLGDPARDVRHTMLLEDPAAPPADGDPTAGPARIAIEEHGDEVVRLRVSNPSAGYLRLADPFDQGWRATVDGRPVVTWIADHYFRAVHLPPGEHEVVFAYRAPLVWIPLACSGVGLLVLLGLTLIAVRQARPNTS